MHMRSHTCIYLQASEVSMFGHGFEGGLVVSESDDLRHKLLIYEGGQQHVLSAGIPVSIFKTGHAQTISTISLRMLDSDMYTCGCHPIQETQEHLTALMLDSARANEHVKHMVETKLCNSQCVKLDRHAGRPHCRSVSALQYITRQDLVSTDTRFNHHIKQNLIDYIVRTFFNRQYLQHIIAQKDRSHVHVSCVAAYLCSPRIYLTCKNLQDGSWQGNISDASLFAKFIVLQKQLQGPTTVAVTNKHTQEASTMSSNMR